MTFSSTVLIPVFIYVFICDDVSLVDVYISDCLRRQQTVKRLEALGPVTGVGAGCTPGSYPAGPSVYVCVSFRASSLPQMVECGEISIYQCLLESDLG